jgi:hypothetical protein
MSVLQMSILHRAFCTKHFSTNSLSRTLCHIHLASKIVHRTVCSEHFALTFCNGHFATNISQRTFCNEHFGSEHFENEQFAYQHYAHQHFADEHFANDNMPCTPVLSTWFIFTVTWLASCRARSRCFDMHPGYFGLCVAWPQRHAFLARRALRSLATTNLPGLAVLPGFAAHPPSGWHIRPAHSGAPVVHNVYY